MNLFFNGKKKLVVLSLLLVGLLALVGCSSSDNDVTKHNVSGQIVDGDGNPVSGVTLSAGDKKVETDEEGKWSFTEIKKDTKITPVSSSLQEAIGFEPSEITVQKDAEDLEFEVVGASGYSHYVEAIDYIEDGNNIKTYEFGDLEIEDETIIGLKFSEDLRLVDSESALKDAITIEGLPSDKEYSVNFVENESNEDGDDVDYDYLEDKDLIIRINGRVEPEVKVKIEPNTFRKADADGEAGKEVRAIETKYLQLKTDTALKAANNEAEFENELGEYPTHNDILAQVNNEEKEVVVNLQDIDEEYHNGNDRLPKVYELYSELTTVTNSEAEIIEIADRVDEDSNFVVSEDQKIVVRAENGSTAEYTIKLDENDTLNTVSSKSGVNGKYYTVNADSIESNKKTISWDTETDTFKKNLTTDSVDTKIDEYSIVATQGAIDAGDSLEELSSNEPAKLNKVDDFKLVVASLTGDMKIYDIVVEEPNHTTNIAAVDGLDDTTTTSSGIVFDVKEDSVVVNSTLEDSSTTVGAIFTPLEDATIDNADDTFADSDSINVTAQDDVTEATYTIKYKPAIVEAKVEDNAANIVRVGFSEEMGLSKSGFTVKVDGEEKEIKSIHNEGTANNGEGIDLNIVGPEVARAKIELEENIKADQDVTLSYNPDTGDINAEDDNEPLYAYENLHVDNWVEGPEFKRAEISDDAPYKIVVTFNEIAEIADRDFDDADITDNFTVKENGEKRAIETVTRDDIEKDDNIVTLTLKKKALEDEDFTVTYEPSEIEYFVDADGDQTLGFTNQGVASEVDAPEYEMIPAAIADDREEIADELGAGVDAEDVTTDVTEDAVFVSLDKEIEDTVEVKGDPSDQFTVALDDETYQANNVKVLDGNILKITIPTRILGEDPSTAAEKIQVSYEPADLYADDNIVADQYGNVVPGFGAGTGNYSDDGKSVPNEIVVPEFDSATTNAESDLTGENTITLTFTDDVQINNDGDAEAFDITVADTTVPTEDIEAVEATSSNAIELQLDKSFAEYPEDDNDDGEVIVSYKPQHRDKENHIDTELIVDNDVNSPFRHNRVRAFGPEVVGTIDVQATLQDAVVENQVDKNNSDDPAKKIKLTFDEGITADSVEASDFDVTYVTTDTQDTVTANVSAVDVNDNVITVELDDYVPGGADLNISDDGEILDDDETQINPFDVTLTPGDGNNVEELTLTGGTIVDHNTIKLDLNKVLDIDANDPDFDFNADYADDFADDNFIVRLDGSEVKVTNTKLIDNNQTEGQIELTLNQPIDTQAEAENVTVEYDHRGENNSDADEDHIDSKITDGMHNYFEENIAPVDIENIYEFASYNTAYVADENPETVVAEFSNEPTDSNLTPGAITVEVDGTATTVAAINARDDNLEIRLENKVEEDQTVDISTSVDVEFDNALNTVGLSNESATNYVEGPKYANAVINDDASNEVVVTFEEKDHTDDGNGNDTSVEMASTATEGAVKDAFGGTVDIDGEATTISAVDVRSDEVTLTLARNVSEHDLNKNAVAADVSYNDNRSLVDENGNAVDSFSVTNETATNNVVNDAAVDYDRDIEVEAVSSTQSAIVVPMEEEIEYQGINTINDLELRVQETTSGNDVTIDNVEITSGGDLKLTIQDVTRADNGNLTVYYHSQASDNLVVTGKDPVKTFSVHAVNNLE